MKRLLFAFVMCGALVPLHLSAQGIQKSTLEGVSLRSLGTWYNEVGSDAARIFAKWGILFGGGAKVEMAEVPPIPIPVLPRPEPPSIRNLPPEGSEADVPLVIDFRFPLRAVSFEFFGGVSGNTARVSGFNAAGEPLGTLEYDVSQERGITAKIEASAPEGISKLVIKYAGDQKDEEIGNLKIQFVDPPIFKTVLPQVADGALGEDQSLITALTILNLSNTRSTGEVRFYDLAGSPLLVPINGHGSVSQLPLLLDLNESRTFSTLGISQEALAGYAVVQSSEPLQTTVHYRTMHGARILSEVSGNATVPRHTARGSFERSEPGGTVGGGDMPTATNTGLGLVNLSDQPVTVRVWIRGQGIASDSVGIPLPPRGHHAVFISEIFSSLGTQVSGMLGVSSPQPLCIALVRTGNGLPLSVLPLGTLEEE